MSLNKSSCLPIHNVCIDFTQATLESPAQGSCDNLEKLEGGIEKASEADAQLDSERGSTAMNTLATSPDAVTLLNQTVDAQVSYYNEVHFNNEYLQQDKVCKPFCCKLFMYAWGMQVFAICGLVCLTCNICC